ncbi:HlyD family secretion protein [Phenylobacterium sp. LjRoot219]|uniref:HlyD family secretion protein n=1 Tax=Phenylobacterium sp. LjRoot219 TaxID=3342283 RepID=UPI003ECE7A39
MNQTDLTDARSDARALGQRETLLRRMRWPLILGGPLVILLIVGWFVLTGGRFETTDNAYVQIAKVPVAPSIAGRVTDIYVKENQVVRRGTLLFRLDSRDFQANQAAAAAQLAQAEQQVQAQRAAYQQAQASVQAAEATATYSASEEARQRRLAAAGVASQQQVAQAVHNAAQARAQLAGAKQQAAQALANLGGDASGPLAKNASVMQAQANLQRAKLNVSYTDVYALSDGVVTRVEQMPVGTYLNASQTAFWLLSGTPWIEANFKEDQLAHMRVGQAVSIKVDAYPDADLTGHVASFSPGTGSAFSALPAQNATGNWVKVVQRLPVRIDFDKPPPGMAARAGLSAKVKVDVRAPARAG